MDINRARRGSVSTQRIAVGHADRESSATGLGNKAESVQKPEFVLGHHTGKGFGFPEVGKNQNDLEILSAHFVDLANQKIIEFLGPVVLAFKNDSALSTLDQVAVKKLDFADNRGPPSLD